MSLALDNFIIIKGDDSGNVTLQLSNYAAWAILRRLQGQEAADDVELEYVNSVIEQMADNLN